MKTVLVIAYYWPPSGGAGVQRILKFVKYLPERGWRPVVLTVNEKADYPVRDESLLKEVSLDVAVIRTSIFEPYALYRAFTGKETGASTDIPSLGQERTSSFSEKISELVRATFFIPDARCFWPLTAVPAGLRAIRDQNVDMIFSSGPPSSGHLVARALQRRSGLPWAAEFRDSWKWLTSPRRWLIPGMIDRHQERSVLHRADRLIASTEWVRQDMIDRTGLQRTEKFLVLRNGFDGADFEGIAETPSQKRFTITHTGSLYGRRDPSRFLQAVRLLLERRPEFKQSLLIRFVGRIDYRLKRFFEPFGDMVEQIDYVEHRKCVRYLIQSHLLLLLIDEAPVSAGIVTGKLYEYLAARRPVLALAPEGEAADLVRRLSAGSVAPPEDPEKISRVLEEYLLAWQDGRLTYQGKEAEIAQLEKRELTGRLAAIFDELHEGRRSGE